MRVVDELISDFQQKRLMLFVGSGVSAALGLPPWSGLMDHMARELDFDRRIFSKLGSFPMLAEFYLQTKRREDLVDWMRREWHAPSIEVTASPAHRLIAQSMFPLIYTTNYDHWLELAHAQWNSPCLKIVSANDMTDIRDGITQIVKFHGDLDDPKTMVLSESDYFERLPFEADLDIKLRSDILRYSILFVGYSLSDVNVRAMLHRLSVLRKKLRAPHSALKSYVLLNARNAVQSSILDTWNIESLYSKETDSGEALVAFLTELRSGDITSVESASGR